MNDRVALARPTNEGQSRTGSAAPSGALSVADELLGVPPLPAEFVERDELKEI